MTRVRLHRLALGVVGVSVGVIVVVVVAGASGPEPRDSHDAHEKSSGDADKKSGPPTDAFTGLSYALHATDIYGPESGFRIAGWSSWGGGSKLIDLVADGTEVKAGQDIARLDFQGKDALSNVTEKIAKAEARAAQARIASQQTLDALVLDKKAKEIEARLAQINVDRERAVSRRQGEMYRISRRIADFEVGAVTARIESADKENEAEKIYQDLVVARAKSELDRYSFYERRFVVKAPHDGIVRHAYNGNEHRKIQKGDSVGSGMNMMSLAKDAALGVRFFVPEHRAGEVPLGADVVVTTAGTAAEHRAVVTHIDYFPQELGFLLDNDSLPNGREKAFAVTADFVDAPEGMTAGTELIVKARRSAAPSPAITAAAPAKDAAP